MLYHSSPTSPTGTNHVLPGRFRLYWPGPIALTLFVPSGAVRHPTSGRCGSTGLRSARYQWSTLP